MVHRCSKHNGLYDDSMWWPLPTILTSVVLRLSRKKKKELDILLD